MSLPKNPSTTSSKRYHSILQQNNPQNEPNNLVNLKKKKTQHNQLKNLKLTVEKQLKFLMKKDQNLLKNYMKKKQQLKKQINKKQRYQDDKNYKSWLQQKKQQQLQKRKMQTQKLKTNIKQSMHSSIQKNLRLKRTIASRTKSTISDWKLQKHHSEQKLLQHNQKIYAQIGQSRLRSRQSSRNFFQKRHSLIVKSCRQQINKEERKLFHNKKMVQKMQNDLLMIKQKSQKKLKMISKLEQDIISVRNQSANLSMSRMSASTPRNLLLRKQSGQEILLLDNNNQGRKKKLNSRQNVMRRGGSLASKNIQHW